MINYIKHLCVKGSAVGLLCQLSETRQQNRAVINPCAREGANKRGNSSRLTQSFHFFMFEPIFSPVNALNQPI
ncbi:hypothetical protein B6J61_03870 [Klebsiella pneumoniae]|nr:hypothetical protein B6J61_03870 [Klebsiella pneumoniae]